MSDNVVNLRGKEILSPYEPNPGLVKTLEDLLEEARSGQIQQINAVLTHGDETVSTLTMGGTYREVGALYALATELSIKIINEE